MGKCRAPASAALCCFLSGHTRCQYECTGRDARPAGLSRVSSRHHAVFVARSGVVVNNGQPSVVWRCCTRVPERFQSLSHVPGSGLLSFAVLPLIFLSHVGEGLQLHSSYRQRFPDECLLVPERRTACVAQVRPHPGRPHFVQCPAPFSCSSEARSCMER